MTPEEYFRRQTAMMGEEQGNVSPALPTNWLKYYLGPLADTLNSAGNFAWALSPGDDYQYSAEGFTKMLAPDSSWVDRLAGLGEGIAGAAMFAAPGVTAGMLDDATRMAIETAAETRPMRSVDEFIGNEYGGATLPTRKDPAGVGAIDGGAGASVPATVYDLPPGSDPRYLGAAPDRSDLTYLRYAPAKQPDRLTKSLAALSNPENAVRRQMDADIARGAELGGMDWYNTEELRDWFVNALGEVEGDRQWREYMYLMGTTSPGSRVEPNIGNASAVRRRLATDPKYADDLMSVETLSDASPLARGREKGYGHKTAGLQELVTARYLQGGFGGMPEPGVPLAKSSMTTNPKPKGFANSLLGNERNIAADLHFTRYMGMASGDPAWLENVNDVSNEFAERIMKDYPGSEAYFKTRDVNGKSVWSFSPKRAVTDGVVPMDAVAEYPSVWASKPNDNEYAAFEKFVADYGADGGMTPHQVQANLWMGAADRTGVDPDSQGTFMEILRNRADKTAAKTGRTRAEVIDDFIRNYGLLSGVGGMLGGGVLADQYGPPSEGDKNALRGYLEKVGL